MQCHGPFISLDDIEELPQGQELVMTGVGKGGPLEMYCNLAPNWQNNSPFKSDRQSPALHIVVGISKGDCAISFKSLSKCFFCAL